jgi:serine/threonine protein kinase
MLQSIGGTATNFQQSREAAVFTEFLGWFSAGCYIYLAMEYVPLGDLEKNVVAHTEGKIPEIEARDVVEQILSGLQIMHEEDFAHRDLKPQVRTRYNA